jgi:DNA modification methylase
VGKPIVVRKRLSAPQLSEAEARQLGEQVSGMAIEFVATASVKSNPTNAKKHPRRQIELIAENMRRFGLNHPVLIDEDNMLIGGHARMAAARLLNLKEVPALRLCNLSEQEKRAVALADNRLAELGTWNADLLRLELKELTADIGELNFDIGLTGFHRNEIDQILGIDTSVHEHDAADELPPLAQIAVTEPGDLWACGDHRLYCGSALEASSYLALLAGAPAKVAVVDPLYNVPVAEPVAKRGDFGGIPISARTPTSEEFTDFLQSAFVHIAGAVADGGVVYAFTDWSRLDELSAATRGYFGKPKNMAVWVKAKAGQGAFYRSQHRHVAMYVAGDMPRGDNFRFGERRRRRSNVWSYAGAKSCHQDEGTVATLTPVALVVDALRDSSRAGQIVLDPFGGIGTTMIAAERSGRRAHVIEIDPIYCDLIVRRWETFSGKVAHFADSNESFADVRARRAGSDEE